MFQQHESIKGIFEYEKCYPLNASEKLATLQYLAGSGYAIKPLVESLGYDFEAFISQSLYEIDELDLRNKIKPPLTSYTATGDDLSGKDNTNESTENSHDNNDSKTPRANK